MSYILESLKKSDKERKTAENPAADALRGAPEFMAEPQERDVGFWTLLLVFILLLAGGFGVGWYYSKGEQPVSLPNIHDASIHDTLPERVLDQSQDVNQPQTTGRQPEANQQQEISQQQEINQQEVNQQEKQIHDLLNQAVTEETESIILVEQPPEDADTQALYKALDKRTSQAVKTPEVTELYQQSQQAVREFSENKVQAAEAGTTEQKTEQKPAVSTIPSVFNLDAVTRQQIPKIHYGAHIYASDHRSGFVILNGAKKKAGDQLRNGVYIEKVEADAVVLSYQGVVFLLPAMKSWNP